MLHNNQITTQYNNKTNRSYKKDNFKQNAISINSVYDTRKNDRMKNYNSFKIQLYAKCFFYIYIFNTQIFAFFLLTMNYAFIGLNLNCI